MNGRSRYKWHRIRRSTQGQLRKLVAAQPRHLTAEIIAASEKTFGTGREAGKNWQAAPKRFAS